MKRIIKFRGFSNELQQWFFGDLNQYDRVLKVDDIEVTPDSIGQFTGLTDKNGKEIYDGDVCKFNNRNEKSSGIGFVYWSNEGAYWAARTRLPFLLHQSLDTEIIGNAFENPKLLK